MAAIPRILIVEDDEIIRSLITAMLERRGYGVVGQLDSGEEAIVKSVELEPDLVLMDRSGVDGYQPEREDGWGGSSGVYLSALPSPNCIPDRSL